MREKIEEEQRDIAKIFALNVQIFLRVENFFPKITALLSRQKRGTKEKNVLEKHKRTIICVFLLKQDKIQLEKTKKKSALSIQYSDNAMARYLLYIMCRQPKGSHEPEA